MRCRGTSESEVLVSQQPANCGPFPPSRLKTSELGTGWLGREDSNLRMVESKSGYLANEINMHSEQPAKFSPICINRLAGYSE